MAAALREERKKEPQPAGCDSSIICVISVPIKQRYNRFQLNDWSDTAGIGSR